MQKLIIKGKRKLSGIIKISGSKNATLPILAAAILSKHTKLTNAPFVKDIFTMLDLLKFIGLKVLIDKKNKVIEIINKKETINTLAPYQLVKTMRAGVLVLGSLLTKYKKAKVSLPGGCAIGTRPVDIHLFALKKLGAKIKIKDGYILAEAKRGLVGNKIKFPSVSVGATENALLAAYGAKGKTVLLNCAIEPEILNLIHVKFQGTAVSESNLLPGVAFDVIEHASLLLMSAEASGGIAGALNVIVDYLKTRKQFDKQIGSYQALKHPTVDILMGSEMSRSYVYHAATKWAEGASTETIEEVARMAKACSSEQFAEAGDRAVQFHGGFGFTYDCDAQLFLRRALWHQYQWGDDRYQRGRLAETLLMAS